MPLARARPRRPAAPGARLQHEHEAGRGHAALVQRQLARAAAAGPRPAEPAEQRAAALAVLLAGLGRLAVPRAQVLLLLLVHAALHHLRLAHQPLRAR